MNDFDENVVLDFAVMWLDKRPEKPTKGERKIVLQFARLMDRMMKGQVYVKKEN